LLARKGGLYGFTLPASDTPDYLDFAESPRGCAPPDVHVSQDQMLAGRRHDGTMIRVCSALFEGRLIVRNPDKFMDTLQTGIGHAKVTPSGSYSVGCPHLWMIRPSLRLRRCSSAA
jgi:CRISPR system Cascade subunit CasE